MRKKCFKRMAMVLCSLLIAVSTVAVQPVNARANASNRDITDSFTCSEFLAFVREITGIPHPGRIHQSDVEQQRFVTNITDDNSLLEFTSLNGIQYFTGLIDLWVIGSERVNRFNPREGVGSQLTVLDVSNNHALEGLIVDGNQLTTLDLSNNRALRHLDVGGNRLTTLDVSNNHALYFLNAFSNQLITLNVSNNRALQNLEISYNQLTTLDISNNPTLAIIEVAGNQLTTLNVSNNPITRVDVRGNVMASKDAVIGWQGEQDRIAQGFITFLFDPQNTPATTQAPTTQTPATPETTPTTPPATAPQALRLAIGNTTYTQNNIPRQMDAAPFIAGGRTMVPLALIAESLGADVTWNGATRTVTVLSEGTMLMLVIDVPLPNNMGTPVISNGRTFVPIAFISQMLGADVRWDGVNRAVYIQQ